MPLLDLVCIGCRTRTVGAVGKDEIEDGIGEGSGIDTSGSVEEEMEVKVLCRIESKFGVTIGADDWEVRTSAALGLMEACGVGVVRGLYGPKSEG